MSFKYEINKQRLRVTSLVRAYAPPPEARLLPAPWTPLLRNAEYARVGRRRAARALLSVLRHGGGLRPGVAVLPAFLLELRRDPRRTRLLYQVNISGMESLCSVRLECLSSVVFFTFSSPSFFLTQQWRSEEHNLAASSHGRSRHYRAQKNSR